MAPHRKSRQLLQPSRHQRDVVAWRQAAQAAPRRPSAPLAPAPPPAEPPPAPATLNWQALPGESFLVPRRLAAQELPELQQSAVRALIDLTAQGLPTPPALRTQLLAVDVDTLQAAIIEGIHRWHTYR